MCGIAGFVSVVGRDPRCLASMAQAIRHRGQDGHGYLFVARDGDVLCRRNERWPVGAEGASVVGLAHQRLAIIDVGARSDQPFVTDDDRYAIVFNGEIYNYVELRRELERLGYRFRTASDTEVLLTAYREWGLECVDRLVGMWAFALLDLVERRLVLCRDRFGIKPLYYWSADGEVLFASEIKGVLAALGRTPPPDETAVARFLIDLRADDRTGTFYEGVSQLGPARIAVIPLTHGERISQRRYWRITSERFGGSDAEAITEWRERFFDAVRLHQRSDVAVGTCLSGGLDSSAIVCAADKLRSAGSGGLHFAFGYCAADRRLSERPHMELVASQTGVGLTPVSVSEEEMLSSVPLIVAGQDEPFGSASIVAQWHVFRAAAEAGLKVMLDGQGADEVLAGYHWYLPTVGLELARSGRPLAYLAFARAYGERFSQVAALHATVARGILPPRVRAASSVLRRRSPAPAPEASARIASLTLRERAGEDRAAPPLSLNELLRRQTEAEHLPALLRYEDRNSMAHSVEARVPYLDHRLVDFTFTLPMSLKVRGLSTKHVLREALAGVLPEAIRTRTDKIGFRADPQLTWRFAARHLAELDADTELERRWFAPRAVRTLLDSPVRGRREEFLLWRVINLKLWARRHW